MRSSQRVIDAGDRPSQGRASGSGVVPGVGNLQATPVESSGPSSEHQSRRGAAPLMVTAFAEGGVGTSAETGNGLRPTNGASALPVQRGQRMRWTREMNISIMRAYYRSTKVETEKEGYRQRMFEEWRNIYPESTLDEQRVCSQLNSIKRRKVLSEAELQSLKQEISVELQIEPHTEDAQAADNTQQELRMEEPVPEVDRIEEATPSNQGEEDTHMQNLRDQFLRNDMLYGGMALQDMPKIPKSFCNAKFFQLCNMMNLIIQEKVVSSCSLEEMVGVVKIGALTVSSALGLKVNKTKSGASAEQSRARNKEYCPPWKRKIEEKINKARKGIAHISEFLSSERECGKKAKAGVRSIARRMKLRMNSRDFLQRLKEEDEKMRQRIAALGARIRRFNESAKRRKEESEFALRQKELYRRLERGDAPVQQQLPDRQAMYNFWSGIWSVPKQHDKESPWLQEEERIQQSTPMMAEVEFSVADLKKAISSTQNWKAPGVDGVQNVWWKYFPCTHPVLAEFFQRALQNPHIVSRSFVKGITYMLPKKGDMLDPKNYRPVTCLPTVYKLLTSVLATKIYEHLADNDLMAPEQNGCRKGAQGCKELLVIDGIIAQQVRKKSHNISLGWVDYKKAFDSVPHSWLKQVMELYRISPSIINFLVGLMSQWRTMLQVGWGVGSYQTEDILIKRGIFQGDSLSPLWFCMALIPLSRMLRTSGYGYVIQRNPEMKVSHFFYMDDLKVYAASPIQLKRMLELIKNFSDSICMEFGLDKCALLQVARGNVKCDGGEVPQITQETLIQSLSQTDDYKYLGLAQLLCRVDTAIRKEILKKTLQRVEKVCRTALCSRNKITAINTWAVPVAAYTFGVVKWSDTALQDFDRKVRAKLTGYRNHHPRSSMQRLYLPRNMGGRGLLSLEVMCRKQEEDLRKYFLRADNQLLKTICKVDNNYSPLCLVRGEQQAHITDAKDRMEIWKQKELHGRFAAGLHSELVDLRSSTEWLQTGRLFSETEGFLFAIQDQVINTRAYKKFIMGQAIDSNCRLCRRTTESIQHICGGCPMLSLTEYLQRHNNVAKVAHQALAKRYGLVESETPYYKCKPEQVLNGEAARLLWDCAMTTDRPVEANRPDIVLFDRGRKEAFIVDVAVPLDENLVSTVAQKKRKYQPLSVELKDMYRLRSVQIVPIVISTNGLVTKDWIVAKEKLGLRNWHLQIMQKAAILGTTNIVRKFLSME